MDYKKIFSIAFILGLIPFNGDQKALAEKQENVEKGPDIILCYAPRPVETPDNSFETRKKKIEIKLSILEQSYKMGSINETTYESRKTHLEKEMQSLDKEFNRQ